MIIVEYQIFKLCKGAKKIYGLDISSGMIEAASKALTQMGLRWGSRFKNEKSCAKICNFNFNFSRSKFELICHDIFDTSFSLPEKVDCVVLSYTTTTFVSSFDMLCNLMKRFCVSKSNLYNRLFLCNICVGFIAVVPFGKLLFIHALTNATDDHKYSPLPSADFDI